MRDYAKISPQFWIGRTGKALRKLGAEVQLVALYLVSNPHANMLGLYYLPLTYIAHETGLSQEAVASSLEKCIEAKFCDYDEDAEMIWVCEMARFQIADYLDPNDKQVKGVINEIERLPKTRLLAAFVAKFRDAFHLPADLLQSEATHKGLQSPLQAPAKPGAGTGAGNTSCPRKFSDEDMGLANQMFEKILLLNPKHKKPDLEKWADEIRLMRERDERTHGDIADLFAWANADSFWRANILSPAKLREQWDKLEIKRRAVKPAADDSLFEGAK